MGIDSVAILVHWILNPASRSFPLHRLVCITAMTGEEHDRTGELMERHVLPLMREHNIRYVQLSRAGQAAHHRYSVLSDTRSPRLMHMRGPWRLSHEMRSGGTLPSVRNGRRWCSERAKGEVLDWWVNDNMPSGYTHVVGFAAEERRRALRDTAARTEKQATGKTVACVPSYPLLDQWQWDRTACAEYLRKIFGEPFPRSCCRWCPFTGATAGSRPELLQRWRQQPDAAADAIELEYTALALNPRIGAFGVGKTAIDLAREHDLTDAVAIAEQRIEAAEVWDVLEIRRIFLAKDQDPRRKGDAWRSVQVAATGSRSALLEWLARLDNGGQRNTDQYGITRLWRRRLPGPQEISYPATEWLWVLVPHGVQPKKRPGFEERWTNLHAATLF
ncbi:hypothetical protein D5S17_35670 [Pseudonocardiaceae bacterium YIM PH 21723]|nr:hypothetical protein D5S17_35670 [Pseudonocardiaceae bacterium YIM PH 21723]